MNSHTIANISDSTNNQNAVTRNYLVNYHESGKINKSGSMSRDVNMVDKKITNLLNLANKQ